MYHSCQSQSKIVKSVMKPVGTNKWRGEKCVLNGVMCDVSKNSTFNRYYAHAGEKCAERKSRIDYHQKMTPVRMRSIERMMAIQRTVATLTTFNQVDMSNLFEMLKDYSGAFEEKNSMPLTYMSFFVKAAAMSLQENPSVNASMDENSILQYKHVDIAVSMATDTFIANPVLRNLSNCTVGDIERQLNGLKNALAAGQMPIEDLTGATFSIANDGAIGALLGTQITNSPQSAILGLNAIHQRPNVQNDGSIKISPMMYISLTYDHRVIDGKEAVTTLKQIKSFIENPDLLFLNL